MEIKSVCRPGEKAANEEEPLRVVSFFRLRKGGSNGCNPQQPKKIERYAYIAGTELREETDWVLKPSRVLLFDMSLPKIICDGCSMVPDK